MSEFIATTITVPERANCVSVVTKEFAQKNIPYRLYMDKEHRGIWWNQARMFVDLCNGNINKHIITTTDDIEFKSGWLDRVLRVLNETDFDVIALFTNQNTKPDNALGIRKACYRMWMYDQAVVWRKGVLNQKFIDGLMDYCKKPERTQKELRHLDCMMSAYTFDSGYKCCTLRPNAIRLQNVKSVVGHKIVIKDN